MNPQAFIDRLRLLSQAQRAMGLSVLVHGVVLIALTLSLSHNSTDEPMGAASVELWASASKIIAPFYAVPLTPPAVVQETPAPPAQAQIVVAKEAPLPPPKKPKAKPQEPKTHPKPAAAATQPKLPSSLAKPEIKPILSPTQTAKLAEQREANLKRLLGQASAHATTGGIGTPTGSSGSGRQPSAGYEGRIKAQIKPNIVFTNLMAGNPVAEVSIKIAPDGKILQKEKKLIRSSGNPEWDEAVLRAIERTEMLPLDTDGKIPLSMVLSFTPKD